MNICLLTQTNSAFKPVSDITFPILEEYCHHYNYNLHNTTSETWERSVVWDRYKILSDFCDHHDVLSEMSIESMLV